MGLGPVHAATPILQRHGLGLNDLDAWEINEAFAAQVMGCVKAWEDPDYCARTGLDAPLGTLDPAAQHRRRRHRARPSGRRLAARASCCICCTSCAAGWQTGRGIATICIGGGQGGAVLVEAV
jgi:acetyl-CoA C-acetyltransferase